jgi:hypothetical protein
MKNKWVAALRSGEYMKGSHFLRNKHGQYCCLGVLCQLDDKLKGEDWIKLNGENPDEVESFVGYIPSETIGLLMDMNDNHGLSFPEIADWIEENL